MTNLGLEQKQIDFIDKKTSFVGPPFDLNELCKTCSYSSFYLRVSGDSMVQASIYNEDILHVKKILEPPSHGDIIVASVNGEFTVKYYHDFPVPSLVPANSNYKPIVIEKNHDFEVFGLVVSVIRNLR